MFNAGHHNFSLYGIVLYTTSKVTKCRSPNDQQSLYKFAVQILELDSTSAFDISVFVFLQLVFMAYKSARAHFLCVNLVTNILGQNNTPFP